MFLLFAWMLRVSVLWLDVNDFCPWLDVEGFCPFCLDVECFCLWLDVKGSSLLWLNIVKKRSHHNYNVRWLF